MKSWFIYASLLYLFLVQIPIRAAEVGFCERSKFVPLDQVLSEPTQFLNKRIQTNAVLRTDGKEYTRISLDEGSRFSVLTTADNESTAYYKRNRLSVSPPFDVFRDLFKKLHAREGEKYKPDMTKIQYYRQDVLVCGRLVGSMGNLRFAVDDMRIAKSYLLPWKH